MQNAIFRSLIFLPLIFSSCSDSKSDLPTSRVEFHSQEPSMLKSFMQLKNGVEDGYYFETDRNGNILHQFHYKNGKLDGHQMVFYRGDYSSITLYVNGVKEGAYKKYYKGGKTTQEEGVYVNDKKDGLVTWFYNDKKHTKSLTSTYKNGVLDGVSEKFYPSGNLKARVEYKNGEKQGEWQEFEDIIVVK
jgi:antitoxin component YwqK of YwqJK toxin-antitoxin module